MISWIYNLFYSTDEEPTPIQFNHLLWALAYSSIFFFFHAAASPLVKNKRKSWSAYTVIYTLAAFFMITSVIGHSRFKSVP